jgi:murein DD-endopeptidase MepM/ murein hydrolase activator NlpD
MSRWPLLDRRHILLLGGAWLLGSCTSRHGARGPAANEAREAAARPPALPDNGGALLYTVQRGDTLSAISRRSGLSVQAIIAANRLDSPAITSGQLLHLPGITALQADPFSLPGDDDPAPPAPLIAGYRLVSRSAWTKEPVRPNHIKMGAVQRITVHHTSEHGRMSRMSDVDIVRLIERYHRDERKWAAIGYHYLVGHDGQVFEGRPASIQGAHTRSNNSNNLGISMIGDFNTTQPSAQQVSTLEALLDDLRRRHGVPKRLIFGHRDLSPSVCPGKHLYAWVQQYKKR